MTENDFERDGEFVLDLVQSGVSLAEGFPRLIEFCQSRYPKRDWEKIAAVDLAADIETMVNWLTHVLTTEPPPANIAAYYFGLYTPTIDDEETCSLSILGSTWFSVETSEWAVWDKDGYHPNHRDDLPINNLNRIYAVWNSTLFDNNTTDSSLWTDTSEYALFLGYAGLMVSELGRRISPQLWLGSASECVLAVGWNEGDIFEVGKITPVGFEKWQPPVYTFEELLDKLQNSQTYSSRWYLVDQMGKLGDERAIEPLVEIIWNDSDSSMPFHVIRTLPKIGGAKVVDALIQMFHHPSKWIQKTALETLVSLAPLQAIEPLNQVLRDNKSLRPAAKEGLVKIGTSAVPSQIENLRDESRCVRGAAAEILGQIGDKTAVDPLIAALADSEHSVREAAARALGLLGDNRAIDPLIRLLDDPEEVVLYTAMGALGRIGDLRVYTPIEAGLRRIGTPDALALIEPLERERRAQEGLGND